MSNTASTKKSIAIFLAAILIVGTFAAISPSLFMLRNVQAQSNYERDNSYDKDQYGNSYEPDYGNDNRYDSYEPEYTDKTYNGYKPDHYGMGNDYDKKSYGYESEYPSYGKDDKSKKDDNSKSVSINKIKCINTNLNINGNNAGNVSLGNKGTTEEQGYLGTYSSGGYYDGNNNKQGKGFDCTINNNNNNTNIGGGGNQTIPPDDGDQRTTLNVTKEVACEDERNGASTLSVQQAAVITCQRILTEITPSDFTIQVAGNNPQPSTFNGSATGTNVTIGPGSYTVTETPNSQVTALLANANVNLTRIFTGGCSPSGTGTIEAGIPETCNITNTFTIEEADDVRATLNVTKLVTCEEEENPNPLTDPTCTDLLGNITEDQFNISVTDTNPTPSQFAGSENGTIVQLGAGAYTVTELFDASINADIASLDGNITGPNISFTGDCIQTGVNSTSATGNIAAGGSESCNIVNQFVITPNPCDECFAALPANVQEAVNSILETIPPDGLPQPTTPPLIIPTTVGSIEELCDFLADNIVGVTPAQRESLISIFAEVEGSSTEIATTLIDCLIDAGIFNLIVTTSGLTASNISTADPTASFSQPTIAQGTEEDLSAMEKITKLKTQWLDQLQ